MYNYVFTVQETADVMVSAVLCFSVLLPMGNFSEIIYLPLSTSGDLNLFAKLADEMSALVNILLWINT